MNKEPRVEIHDPLCPQHGIPADDIRRFQPNCQCDTITSVRKSLRQSMEESAPRARAHHPRCPWASMYDPMPDQPCGECTRLEKEDHLSWINPLCGHEYEPASWHAGSFDECTECDR